MIRFLLALAAVRAQGATALVTSPGGAQNGKHRGDQTRVTLRPLIIGHRGAAGYLPEHTLEGYRLGIAKGADYIEPDLVMTKDGVLIARHENNIGETTDASTKFPERKKTKIIDGISVTGYFTEDFTLREIKTLRAKERLASRNHENDFKYMIPTFEEILDLASEQSKSAGRQIGVYPETKHPTYFNGIGLPLEPEVARVLHKHHMDGADDKVFIQSFEIGSLQKLKKLVHVKLIYLLDEPDVHPPDFTKSGDKRTYGDMMKPDALKEIRQWVDGIGPDKRSIVPQNKEGILQAPTHLIDDAHAADLLVHPYTFRSDAPFLNHAYGGDPSKEYLQFFALGVDAVFSDFAGDAFIARQLFLKDKKHD